MHERVQKQKNSAVRLREYLEKFGVLETVKKYTIQNTQITLQ